MNVIIKQESAVKLFGYDARIMGVVADDKTGRIVNQKILLSKYFNNQKSRITAELRFDDNCGNGHESFSITGTICETNGKSWRETTGGCIHDEIMKHFPRLAHLIPWHLTSTDGPMHYVANTVFHAGNRDCHGLLAGEKRQIKNGSTGAPCWQLVATDGKPIYSLEKHAEGEKPTNTPALEWVAWCRTGEGKERELNHARSSAVWPDATDEELMQEPEALKAVLLARLPALIANFKADMLSCGFEWPVTQNAAEAA